MANEDDEIARLEETIRKGKEADTKLVNSGFQKLSMSIFAIYQQEIDEAAKKEGKFVNFSLPVIDKYCNNPDMFKQLELKPLEKAFASLSADEYSAMLSHSDCIRDTDSFKKFETAINLQAEKAGVKLNLDQKNENNIGWMELLINRAGIVIDSQKTFASNNSVGQNLQPAKPQKPGELPLTQKESPQIWP